MANTPLVPPNTLAAYTVIMLEHAARYLLLRRGEARSFEPGRLPGLDVIESTRPVLPLLIADQARDPLGREPVHLGLAGYRSDGTLARVVWL